MCFFFGGGECLGVRRKWSVIHVLSCWPVSHYICYLSFLLLKKKKNNLPEELYDDYDQHSLKGLLVLTLVFILFSMVALIVLSIQGYRLQRIIDARHEEMVKATAKSNVIVASLFPSTVRDRLYADAEHDLDESAVFQNNNKTSSGKSRW